MVALALDEKPNTDVLVRGEQKREISTKSRCPRRDPGSIATERARQRVPSNSVKQASVPSQE